MTLSQTIDSTKILEASLFDTEGLFYFQILNKNSKQTILNEHCFNKKLNWKMDDTNYEESRRQFLAKLGLSVGAVAIGSAKLSATVLNDKTEFPLTESQQTLMQNYERWMDKFIPAVQAQRADQNDKNAKAKIMELSEEAESWRAELTEYMKDENFARYYMTATERLTKEVY
jgi:membrane-associated HD superfamily phosphohydrolase